MAAEVATGWGVAVGAGAVVGCGVGAAGAVVAWGAGAAPPDGVDGAAGGAQAAATVVTAVMADSRRNWARSILRWIVTVKLLYARLAGIESSRTRRACHATRQMLGPSGDVVTHASVSPRHPAQRRRARGHRAAVLEVS